MKKIKLGLLPKIIIAIILGIGFGIVSPDMPVRVFVTFNALFSEFLGFLIPLIIVGSSRRLSPTSAREPANCL